MLIKILIDNTPNNKEDELRFQEGLSIYIESKNNRILLDSGINDDYLFNAKKLNVNLSDVDTFVVSHGHYDHAGGINGFFNLNNIAKAYISNDAFKSFYSMRVGNDMEYIGIGNVIDINRFNKINKNTKVNNEITLFKCSEHTKYFPNANKYLFKKEKGKLINDDFCHEINMSVKDEHKNILFVGCAHNGIYNILKESFNILGCYPDYVIGGFHLPKVKNENDTKIIEELGNVLNEFDIKYITGHCTEEKAYYILKNILKEKIDKFYTGKEIII